MKRENIVQSPVLLQFLEQREEVWNMQIPNSGNQGKGSKDAEK